MSDPSPRPEYGELAATPHVIVVGGGVAGLVAARDLAVAGVRVTLLEASERLGGKVRSHTVGGVELDAGAESFATRGDTVATLVSELGLGHALVTPQAGGAWLQPKDGEAVPLPRAGLLGIPSVPFAKDVLAIIGFRGALRAQLDSLMSGFVGSRERRLGPLVRKRMGRAVLDQLVTPVAGAIHSKHPDDLEVDVVAPRLRKALLDQSSLAHAVQVTRAAAPAGSAVQGIYGGVFVLAEELAKDVADVADVRVSTAVTDVAPGGVTLRDGSTLTADHVVLAAPLGETPGAPIVLVTLVVRDGRLDAAPRGTGVIVAPGASGIRAKALTHASVKWGWLRNRAGDAHVLRLSYDADAASADDLADLARRDAGRLLGFTIDPGAVVDSDRQDWTAPATSTRDAAEGVTEVGERVSGVGLAAVIAHTRRAMGVVLEDLGVAPGLRLGES